MSRYFQITTAEQLPTIITEITSSAARSLGDQGPCWFILRTGRDEAGQVGIHATDLTENQQEHLEVYRKVTPGCPLPADWDDYPNDDAAAARRITGAGDVPLSRRPGV